METLKVGIREFREKLADYLESGAPLAITRHGETLGFYIPAQKRSRKAELEAMRAAAKDLDDKTGSFKGWAEDAKSDINTQLKNDVEAALNLSHFKDFKVALLSRSMREWYQKQQEVLALLPPAPGSPTLPAR